MGGPVAAAYSKGKTLAESDCIISEFGTRRRRSYKTQDFVVDELIKAYKDTPSSRGRLAGTSNVKSMTVTPSQPISETVVGSFGAAIWDHPCWNYRPVSGLPSFKPNTSLTSTR